MKEINDLHKEILNKLDSSLHKNDYVKAEEYLLACLQDAVESDDFQTEILLRNELMGLYRKVGKRDEALSTVEAVLNKIREKGVGKQVGSATTYLNSATVYKAFGMAEKSISLFETAKEIYEKALKPRYLH